jgi:hypothetical protein
MTRSFSSNAKAVVGAGFCGIAVSAAWPVTALAQQDVRVMTTIDAQGGPMGGGGASKVSKAAVEKYAGLLGLSPDQKATALTLHEGYDAAYTQASKEFGATMEDIRKSFEDSQDRSVFMEKMPKARADFAAKTKELEKSFFGDLQAVLNTDQQAAWPRVERQRRREVALRGGTVSGEGVNLLDIVEGLKLPADAKAKLDEIVSEYETDLDRALQSKAKVMEEMQSFDPGRGFDPEAFRERLAKTREAGMKVKEVNERFARRLESLLPDEKKPDFASSVRKASFPQVYRPSRIARSLDAAAGMADLTPEQRESVSTLKASYERDLAAANEKLASAIEESEKKGGNGGEMMLADGGRMAMRFGDEDEKSPLAQARKAKREVEEKAKSRLDTVLTKEQKDRLPKEPERGDGGPGAVIRFGGRD